MTAHLSVCNVQGGDSLHAKLTCMLFCCFLGVVGAIEVFPCEAAFASSHVSTNDEVRAACIPQDAPTEIIRTQHFSNRVEHPRQSSIVNSPTGTKL